MNVSLTPGLMRFVKKTIQNGYYRSASEVVRAGLRLLEAEEEVRHYKRVERLQNVIKNIENNRQIAISQENNQKSKK